MYQEMKNLTKKELRANAKECRKTLNLSQISEQICGHILSAEFFHNAKNIAIFYPKDIEINLLSLCKITDKNFYLPKMKDKNLIFAKFNREKELVKVQYDILEPQSQKDESDKLDLIFIPALIVDKKGYRLGWGGGFYDRFLKHHANIKKICAIPQCQYVENLPIEMHDIPCDTVITEHKIIKTKK